MRGSVEYVYIYMYIFIYLSIYVLIFEAIEDYKSGTSVKRNCISWDRLIRERMTEQRHDQQTNMGRCMSLSASATDTNIVTSRRC